MKRDNRTGADAAYNVSARIWIISFAAGGVLSLIFNLWYLSLWRSSPDAASTFSALIAPLVHGVSSVVPIIPRSRAIVAVTGNLQRATAAQDIYGIDWIICLFCALPSLRFTIRMTKKRISSLKSTDISQKIWKQQQLENRGFALSDTVTIYAFYESWFGSFNMSAPILVGNRVDLRDGDYHRLVWFLPLALLFASMNVPDLYVRWKSKTLARQRC